MCTAARSGSGTSSVLRAPARCATKTRWLLVDKIRRESPRSINLLTSLWVGRGDPSSDFIHLALRPAAPGETDAGDVHDNEHSRQFLLFSSRVLGCRLLRHPAPVRGSSCLHNNKVPDRREDGNHHRWWNRHRPVFRFRVRRGRLS
jgi:hypothetical protein